MSTITTRRHKSSYIYSHECLIPCFYVVVYNHVLILLWDEEAEVPVTSQLTSTWLMISRSLLALSTYNKFTFATYCTTLTLKNLANTYYKSN